jgi:hypothetical protein
MAGDPVDTLIADLVAPGVLVVYYLSDGTTARARYFHDGARPIIKDIQDTLTAAKESNSLIQVESSDIDDGAQFDIYIHPDHIVEVKIEKAGDLLGAVA